MRPNKKKYLRRRYASCNSDIIPALRLYFVLFFFFFFFVYKK